MGAFFSSFAEQQPPPSVVLVPPLLERERKGRSRFAKSAYDRQFGKPQLRMLFGDYFAEDLRAVLHFSPPEDERISVTAKLDVPRGPAAPAGHGSYNTAAARRAAAAAPTMAEEALPTGGSMTLRYQPLMDSPYTFFDIKARTRGAVSSATLRGCMFDPGSRLALFATLPVVAAGPGPRSAVRGDSLAMGLRYTTPAFSAGAIVNPSSSVLNTAWVVGKAGALLWGVQTRPALELGGLFSRSPDRAALSAAAQQAQLATSYAVAYRPEGQSAYGKGIFTAAVELKEQSELSVSFLHHMALQRNVHNPLEDSDVVGITNYVDVGFQMVTDLAGSQGSAMRLGASWQVNKNVLVKGRVGLDGLAASAVFRSWWQPAFTLGAVANLDFRGPRTPRYGIYAAVETFRDLRYERSATGQKMSGARLTQRHVASAEDLAMHEGRGLLVPLEDVDNPEVLGQKPSAGADYL